MKLSALVSWSGKTVELEVGPQARVEAVQQTLADLTGIPKADQILMCEGARLDGSKPLDAYGLPGVQEEQGKVHDLFLYSRAHLRADAPLPPPEALPDCPIDLGGLDSIRQQRHRLDEAGSPLLRLLPDYQRQFREHLLQANARHEASQQRVATCARLVSEQEVQALSIDAATSNVELHYAYICDAFGAFTSRYQQQHAAHAEVLSRFEADLAYLAATELHPSLRGAEGSASAAASPTTLLHLVNAQQLREAASSCVRGHQHFGAKVAELEGLFGMLKADVEALFMQAPSVDLEALTGQLEEMHQQVDEQASTVAALSSDLSKVQQLVEQASEALGADMAASSHVSDSVHMLETMRETHAGHLLPRVEACHAAVEAFAATCVECKNALTRDVFTQLRTISSQQSKIREMKNKLALFREALARQESAVQELLVVRRVPAAYKQCLAECVRRGAFMERYAHSAGQLAERMGTFREKEVAMRDSFRKHVERLIPGHLLDRMGLQEQPPHCQVSVSATEGERLLPVTVDDVRRIQLPWGAAYALAPLYSAASAAAAAGGGGGATSAGSSREGSVQPTAAEQLQQQEEAAAVAVAAAEADVTASLQLENAKLRAELASQIALECVRAMQTAGQAPAPQPAGAAGASGQASPHLALSAGSPRPPPSPAAPGGGAAPVPASAAAAGVLPPEAVQRFERALAAKDGLTTELQAHLGVARQQAAVYEDRIRHLEEQLAILAAAADGRAAAAPLLAGSGSQIVPAGAPVETGAAAATSSASGSPLDSSSAAQAPAASGGSGSTGAAAPAASATMPVASQQAANAAAPGQPGAAAAAAAGGGLRSSVDAAGDSTLSGSLHAPDPSLSLGPSSSTLSASPPVQAPHQQQLPAAALGAQQGQQLAVGGASAALVAAGTEEAPAEAASHASSSASSSSSHGPSPSPAAAPAAGAALPTSITADPGGFAESAGSPQDLQPGGGSEQAAETAVPLGGLELEPVQPAAEAALAEPSRPVAPPLDADAGAEAASPPQPPALLLASVVVDEGSDVEGIEALDDSSDDEAAAAAAAAGIGGGASTAGGNANAEQERPGSGGEPGSPQLT